MKWTTRRLCRMHNGLILEMETFDEVRYAMLLFGWTRMVLDRRDVAW